MVILTDLTRKLQNDDSEVLVPLDRYGLPGCSYSSMELDRIGRSLVNAQLTRTPQREATINLPGTISTPEYARRHGVTEVTVRRWIYAGKVPAIKAQARYRWVFRIPVDEVTA